MRCYICKEYLPRSKFYENPGKSRGYSSECRECSKARKNESRKKERDAEIQFWQRFRGKQVYYRITGYEVPYSKAEIRELAALNYRRNGTTYFKEKEVRLQDLSRRAEELLRQKEAA